MSLIRGFINWGIIVVVLGVLLFLFWKLFLCTRTGYESRKKVMGLGMLSILAVVSTLLFVPIFFKQTDPVMTEVIETLRADTLAKADEGLKENIDVELDSILNNMILEQQIVMTPELEKLKKDSIATAIKFTRKKPFVDTLETTLKLFQVNDIPVIDSSLYDLNSIAYDTVLPYGKNAEKTEIQNPSLRWLFGNCLKTTPLGAISGVESDEVLEKAEKAVINMLSKFFIILHSLIALVIGIFIFVIVLLLREPKNELEELDDRNYLFQFDRINKVTGKKISEELNQYN